MRSRNGSDPQSKSHPKADALIHPVRLRIVFAVVGNKMTPQQIAAKLPDVAQASLYRHIKLLVQADILQVVKEYPVRGAVEKVYAVDEENALLSAEEFSDFSREDHLHYFTQFLTTLMNQLRFYLQQETIDPLVDGVTYSSTMAPLSDSEFREARLHIHALLKELSQNEPTPERRRRIFTLVTIPEKREP